MDVPIETQPCHLVSKSSSMLENQAQRRWKSDSFYQLSSGCTKQVDQAWFDVKVFYVKVSSCVLDQAPDSLLLLYPQRDICTELEVNGGRISPSETACLTLRRDRVDTESAEATYVSTSNLRTTGDLSYEIYDKDELLVYGTLARAALGDEHLFEKYSSVGTSPMSNEAGWSMDCNCGVPSSSCCFFNGRMDFSTVSPTVEVYVAGRNSGLPIVLTQTVQLTARRRSLRCCTLDAIPEDEESQSNRIVAGQIAEDRAYAKILNQPLATGLSNDLYIPDNAYPEGEEGELSWFNAGVRVGVGLGLGMCLGIGVGVGLLIQTYHATTGPFRRRLF